MSEGLMDYTGGSVCMLLLMVFCSSSSCQQLSMTSLSEPPPLSQFLSAPCLGMLGDILPVTAKPFLKKPYTASLTMVQKARGEKKKHAPHWTNLRDQPRLES